MKYEPDITATPELLAKLWESLNGWDKAKALHLMAVTAASDSVYFDELTYDQKCHVGGWAHHIDEQLENTGPGFAQQIQAVPLVPDDMCRVVESVAAQFIHCHIVSDFLMSQYVESWRTELDYGGKPLGTLGAHTMESSAGVAPSPWEQLNDLYNAGVVDEDTAREMCGEYVTQLEAGQCHAAPEGFVQKAIEKAKALPEVSIHFVTESCPECKGKGYVELFNSTEPCSRGCKA